MSTLKEKLEIMESLPLKDDQVSEIQNLTFYEKICDFKSNITVEPVLFISIMASLISKIAVQNLNLDKACRVSKNYGDEICNDLIDRKINSTEHEVEIQNIISAIETWRSVIQTAIPIVLLIFMGAWSDRTGNRKICLLLPIFGEFLVNTSNILSTFFFNAVSVEVTMVLESLLPAITGSWSLLLLGAYSYVCDITSLESRTFRVGLVTLCLTSGMPIGMSLSGLLLNLTGYYGVFSIAASVNLVSFLYGYFTLSSNTARIEKKSVTLVDLITMQKETAAVVFKKRPKNNRMKIILTLLVLACVFAYDHGEQLIYYLFLRYRLNWDVMKYSVYSTYSVVTNTCGSLFAISLFSKCWGWHDSSLCIVAATSKLAGSVFIIFVTTDVLMFMIPIVEVLHYMTYPALRSMASKLVPREELGKINCLMSLMETAGTLVFDPVYSSLYAATMERFTGAVFLFTGVMTLPVLAVFLWLFKQQRRELKQQKNQVETVKAEILEQIQLPRSVLAFLYRDALPYVHVSLSEEAILILERCSLCEVIQNMTEMI